MKPLCSDCGSADVMADAYVEWNDDKQDWEVQNVFEKGAFCNDCGGETSLDWNNDREGEDLDPDRPTA